MHGKWLDDDANTDDTDEMTVQDTIKAVDVRGYWMDAPAAPADGNDDGDRNDDAK